MTKEQLLSKFKEKKYLITMGCGSISKMFGVSVELARECKKITRDNIEKFGTTYHPKEVAFKNEIHNNLKVLFLDIETAPMVSYTWGRWQQNIGLEQTVSEWYILSWSAKWGGDDLVLSGVLTTKEAISEDDSRIMIDLWNVLNQADVVISHNGLRFDHKKINTRFILNGLPPTRPFRIIDTLKIVKENFAFSSNKLDNLLIQFGLDRKLKTEFKLWKDCMNGDSESLKKMSEYNDMDVITLEQAFIKLKPWVKNFPHYALYNNIEDNHICPTCGSKSLLEDGSYTTVANKYKLYRCGSCGSISRNRKAEKIKLTTTNNIR
jgi:uncharacterized protein YprB with RNaseH-like and TPR domain